MPQVHAAPFEISGSNPQQQRPQTTSLESFKENNTVIRTVRFNLASPVIPKEQQQQQQKHHQEDEGLSSSAASSSIEELKFPNNYVRTSRYTVCNFLFINLFEQFCRVANMYFLLIAVLQLVPGLSPTHWFTTVAPLIFVLTINAVKEIYDDYYRHKSDDEVNNRHVKKFVEKTGDEEFVKWRDLTVGSIVRVCQNEEIPADLVFLSSSDSDDLCYVETANLDGETNLKIKYCYSRTASCTSSEELISTLTNRHIECEVPNERLYQFDGSMVDNKQNREGLDVSNLLLRGCTLRKTEWIIGVVVFAGIDSKIQRNQSKGKRKVTQIERHMNILVILVFILQVLLSLIGAIGREVWLGNHKRDYYLEQTNGWPDLGRGWLGGIVTTLRFIILLNQLIPISLYVTLEVVKVIQCLFLNWDRQMYHRDSDTPFVCRTTTLNEDLGQVQYVLSDKTGTLTQNIMGWVWASVNGELYGQNVDLQEMAKSPKSHPHTIVFDQDIKEILNRDSKHTSDEFNHLSEFLLNLAVCNTVVPTIGLNGELQYQAESPDEEALVQGAASLGYKLITRTTEKIEVEVQGQLRSFEILAVLEFSSDRKRMSVICRTEENQIQLYCKGADGVIFSRLASVRDESVELTRAHLEMMAKQGFRTLAIAQKIITEEEYISWREDHHLASVAMNNREEKLAKMAEVIETDLSLIGATAVEDKLQDGVPEAIESMSNAGIKIWVLTGDKMETAVSISFSCSLFQSGMDLIYIKESDVISSKTKCLERKEAEIADLGAKGGTNHSIGLVIEGTALTQMLKAAYQLRFLALCQKCRAVVCCRVSPIQKAQVTNLVRKKARAITLAIGDGANDVGMIQAAHIGVGISGREGRAAVLSSDFAFAQFAFLKRLLLVHGRWSFKRNAEVVWYAFYKNFAYCLANVYLNFFFAGFSSQPVYGSALIATYNVFWTSLPTIGFAILEQDVLPETVLQAPRLYGETMLSNRLVFFKSLGRWLLEGIWHSIVAFGVPLWALRVATPNGKMLGLDETGVAVYTTVILLVNLKIALRTHHWTWINAVFIFLISIGLWFPFVFLCSFAWDWYGYLPEMAGVAERLFGVPSFWISAVIAAPVLGMFIDATLVAFENRFWPCDYRIYQECERTGKFPSLNDSLPKISSSHPSSETELVASTV
eukprot:g9080.t2